METSYFNLIVTTGLTGEQDDDDDDDDDSPTEQQLSE